MEGKYGGKNIYLIWRKTHNLAAISLKNIYIHLFAITNNNLFSTRNDFFLDKSKYSSVKVFMGLSIDEKMRS